MATAGWFDTYLFIVFSKPTKFEQIITLTLDVDTWFSSEASDALDPAMRVLETAQYFRECMWSSALTPYWAPVVELSVKGVSTHFAQFFLLTLRRKPFQRMLV